MRWHVLSTNQTDGDPLPNEVMAACDNDGIGVVASWRRLPDGSWRVWAVDTEQGGEVGPADLEEQELPAEPPGVEPCGPSSRPAPAAAIYSPDAVRWALRTRSRDLDARGRDGGARLFMLAAMFPTVPAGDLAELARRGDLAEVVENLRARGLVLGGGS